MLKTKPKYKYRLIRLRKTVRLKLCQSESEQLAASLRSTVACGQILPGG